MFKANNDRRARNTVKRSMFIKKVVASCENQDQMVVAAEWIERLKLSDVDMFSLEMTFYMREQELLKIEKLKEEIPW
jgi:hypothetical protein